MLCSRPVGRLLLDGAEPPALALCVGIEPKTRRLKLRRFVESIEDFQPPNFVENKKTPIVYFTHSILMYTCIYTIFHGIRR